MNGLTEIDGHENDGHEIGGQDIYRLKIDYITMQCAILFKTTTEYKSQQRGKLYRPPVIVELKGISKYERHSDRRYRVE